MTKIFKKIYSFFDKCIIIPIGRLVFNIQNLFKKNNGWIDKLLNKPNFLIFLSLFLAVVLFLLIDSKAIMLVENNAEVITNVPVKLKYNEEAYVVEGVPETVDITITGRNSDIYLAKQLGEFEVTLDLTDYEASESAYKVYFTYSKSIDNLTYKLDPSYVSVIIKNKVSSVASVTTELINQDKLDSKLSVKSVSLSKSEVVVKGSESSLDKIASIKTLIDLDNDDLTEAGTYSLDNVKLVAYDNSGKILSNVEMVPNTLSATVVLDSYSVNIPLEVKTTGELVSGKSIASILINNAESYSVTVYGNEDDLKNISSIPVVINIDGMGSDNTKKYSVKLTKPTGVRYMSETDVSISVTFGTEEQKTIAINNISKKNLGSSLNANIISTEEINVICKGVTSALENIKEEDINAYVDLTGLSVGDHEVEIKIENTNPLVEYIVSQKIVVRISE